MTLNPGAYEFANPDTDRTRACARSCQTAGIMLWHVVLTLPPRHPKVAMVLTRLGSNEHVWFAVSWVHTPTQNPLSDVQ